MDDQPKLKREWIELLLGEIDDPMLEKQVLQELKEVDCDAEAYGDLEEILSQIEEIHPTEGDDMFDLTYEQKKELYAEFTDVFKDTRSGNASFLPSLRLALSALGGACLIMAVVPLVQFISVPSKTPIEAFPLDQFVEPAPEVYQAPPPPVKPEEVEEKKEEIIYRPSFNELTFSPLEMNGGGVGRMTVPMQDWAALLEDDIIDLADLDIVPRAIKQIAPSYPNELKHRKVSGTVVVEFVINERGVVLQPTVVKSSNHGFDRASLEAIRKWTFEPGSVGGKIVKTRMRIPFVFNVKN